MAKVPFNCLLDGDVKARLQAMAKERGISEGALVTTLVTQEPKPAYTVMIDGKETLITFVK